MNTIAVKLLHEELKQCHSSFMDTMEGVTNEVAAFMPPGKANPIAGTFAHLVFSEDFFAHFFLQGKQPLFESEWKGKTGISENQPTEWETEYPKWLREVKVDIPQSLEYTKAVFAASEAYVATLKDEDLAKEIDMSMFGMGTRQQGSFIAGMIMGHAYSIMGEISVLKGIQGLKGYPF